RRPQKHLRVRYGAGSNGKIALENASITDEGSALGIFGFGPDEHKVRWDAFCERVKDKAFGPSWINAINRMLTSQVDDDSSQVIVASGRLYRLILTTVTTFFGGENEASIYMVEVFRRPDKGNPETTRLLKAILLLCRFRFAFL